MPSPGKASLGGGYGESPGQLGAMPDKGFDLVTSSPPFMSSDNRDVQEKFAHKFHGDQRYSDTDPVDSTTGGDRMSHAAQGRRKARVEQTANLGHIVQSGNGGQLINVADFWSAARRIVEETYKVLAPGAHAIWVVKGFVRKKAYVDFPDQWRQLCEAVGFATLHWHNASLVEHSGTQHTLDGGEDKIEVQRKSFFRRLAESNGSPAINAEVVLCMIKPTGAL